MQAVVLAAGKGTRLYPFTLHKPKPLIRVANKTLLEHNLSQLKGLVTEIIFVVNYKKEMIRDFFGDNYQGLKISYVTQESCKGTGDAVLATAPLIKGKFLVVNGDDLYSHIDIKSLLNYDSSILIQKREDVSSFGVVVVKNNLVQNLVEKPKEFVSPYVNAGLYVFPLEIFNIISALKPSSRGEYEITDAVKLLAQKQNVFCQEVKGKWIPIGYPWQILDATSSLVKNNKIGFKTIISPSAKINGTVLIGDNCFVGENCVLEGYVTLGDNTIINSSTKLNNVVLGNNCNIGEDCVIQCSVLDDKVKTSAHLNTFTKPDYGTVVVNLNNLNYDSKKENLGIFASEGCTIYSNTFPGEVIIKVNDTIKTKSI